MRRINPRFALARILAGMKVLPIVWKRLVMEGQTCTRCAETQFQLERAVAQLEPVLRPLGLAPLLETQVIDEAAFRADPAQSNRVWIAGKPLEEWLGAQVGASPCCSVCGDLPCRTVEAGGRIYEAVPSELIVRAALVAASALVESPPPVECSSTGCCR